MVAIASEDQEQTALAQYLDMRFGEYGWFHPPNGGSRNVIEASKLKRMGVKKGGAGCDNPVRLCDDRQILQRMRD